MIRKKIKNYVAEVDDKKIKALYTLLENDIEENASMSFTNEELEILNEEHELHISGKTKSYTWDEAKDIIRGGKLM